MICKEVTLTRIRIHSSNRVQILVNVLRNRNHFGLQLVLDHEQVGLVVLRDEVDRQTQMTEPARSSDSMQISFTELGEVEVDDHVDRYDVDTTSEQIS